MKGTYCINEKSAIAMVDHFEIKPGVDNIITMLSFYQSNTRQDVYFLNELVSETEALLEQ